MNSNNSDWIDVKDRLPEDGEPVLIKYQRNTVKMCTFGWYNKEHNRWGRNGKFWIDDSLIVAWMNIPE
jgi:hypothetical protein